MTVTDEMIEAMLPEIPFSGVYDDEWNDQRKFARAEAAEAERDAMQGVVKTAKELNHELIQSKGKYTLDVEIAHDAVNSALSALTVEKNDADV